MSIDDQVIEHARTTGLASAHRARAAAVIVLGLSVVALVVSSVVVAVSAGWLRSAQGMEGVIPAMGLVFGGPVVVIALTFVAGAGWLVALGGRLVAAVGAAPQEAQPPARRLLRHAGWVAGGLALACMLCPAVEVLALSSTNLFALAPALFVSGLLCTPLILGLYLPTRSVARWLSSELALARSADAVRRDGPADANVTGSARP